MFPIDTNNAALQNSIELHKKSMQSELDLLKEQNRQDGLQADYYKRLNECDQKGALIFENEQLRKKYENEKALVAKNLINCFGFRELMYKYGSALGKTVEEIAKEYNEAKIDIINHDVVFTEKTHYDQIAEKLGNDPKKIKELNDMVKKRSEKYIEELSEEIKNKNAKL